MQLLLNQLKENGIAKCDIVCVTGHILRINHKEEYGIAMALESIPVESHTTSLAMGYISYLLRLPFVFYWTGNRI